MRAVLFFLVDVADTLIDPIDIIAYIFLGLFAGNIARLAIGSVCVGTVAEFLFSTLHADELGGHDPTWLHDGAVRMVAYFIGGMVVLFIRALWLTRAARNA